MHGEVAWLLRCPIQCVSGCVLHHVVRFARLLHYFSHVFRMWGEPGNKANIQIYIYHSHCIIIQVLVIRSQRNKRIVL